MSGAREGREQESRFSDVFVMGEEGAELLSLEARQALSGSGKKGLVLKMGRTVVEQ